MVRESLLDRMLTPEDGSHPKAQALLDQLAELSSGAQKILAAADAATQTGGVPGAGRVVGGKAPLKSNELMKIVQCICTSIPVMKAMKMDEDLRKLLLAEMV